MSSPVRGPGAWGFRRSLSLRSALALALAPAVLGSPPSAAAQTITGQVVVGGLGEPLEAVEVQLLDDRGLRLRAATTGADGRYDFDLRQAGVYRLRIRHEGYQPHESGEIEVLRGGLATHNIRLEPEEPLEPGAEDPEATRIPGPEELAADCAPPERPEEEGVLVGVVRERDLDGSLPGASVEVRWEPEDPREAVATRETQAGRRGAFRFCRVPVGRPLMVEASLLGRATDLTVVEARPGEPAYLVFELELGRTSRIVGRVVDAGSEVAVSRVAVRLERLEDDEVVRETDTDRDGRFGFDELRPGEYELAFEHDRYTVRRDTVRMQRTGADYNLEVGLAGEPVALEPLEVTVERRGREFLADVRERMERYRDLGLGTFYDREDLERRGGSGGRISQVLADLPGARMVPVGPTTSVPEIARVPEVARVLDQEALCLPVYYVDGQRFRLDEDAAEPIDHYFNLDDVEYLEVYQSPAEIPGRFTGSEAQCGVVAIWTRRW